MLTQAPDSDHHVSMLEESIAQAPDSERRGCCRRCCTWFCARARSWRWDACRACGSFDMNPGTAGNLCTPVESAHLREVFQACAGTNYMVYRKSVLKLAVMLIVFRWFLAVLGIGQSTKNARDMHDGAKVVIDKQVQADCLPLCSSTSAEVVRGVNESFAQAAVASPNSTDLVPWDPQEVEAIALTSCLNLCVGSRTAALSQQLFAGSTCRLDIEESLASNDTIIVCDQKEAAPPSRLEYRLSLIDIAQQVMSATVGVVYMVLLWAAVVSWRHFRSSMKYICIAVFATLGQPYLVSVVPWYELFQLHEVLNDSLLYGLSPDLADLQVRLRVTLPVFLNLQSGLLALFPALSYAAVTAKTFDPGNSFMDALVGGVPVLLLTFNWPLWALIYQTTGSVLFLVGGLLFSGSRLIFTCYFKQIAFSTNTAETISLLSTLSTRYLIGVCLGIAFITAGAFCSFRDVTDQLFIQLLSSFWEIVDFVANYYMQFYVSYIAAADILVFGAVHFGSKRLSLPQLEEEASGLAASYTAITCKDAVFRGGRRWACCFFPV